MNVLNIITRGVLRASSKCLATRGFFCYELTDKYGVDAELVSITLSLHTLNRMRLDL